MATKFYGQWVELHSNVEIQYSDAHTKNHEYCMHVECAKPVFDLFGQMLSQYQPERLSEKTSKDDATV